MSDGIPGQRAATGPAAPAREDVAVRDRRGPARRRAAPPWAASPRAPGGGTTEAAP